MDGWFGFDIEKGMAAGDIQYSTRIEGCVGYCKYIKKVCT